MSDKVRVYEIAEESSSSSQEVIYKAKDLGFELKSPQSAVSFEDAEEIINYIMTGRSSKIKTLELKKEKKLEVKIINEKLITKKKPKNKAISLNKVRIITKNYKKDIDLNKSITNNIEDN